MKIKVDGIEVKEVIEWNNNFARIESNGTLYVKSINDTFTSVSSDAIVDDNRVLDDNHVLDEKVEDFFQFLFGVEIEYVDVPYMQLFSTGELYVPNITEVES